MNYLSVEELSKNYGEKNLFSGISFGIDQGQRVALVAKNGAGKSTLMKILAGKEVADSGKAVFRKDLRIGFLEQDKQFTPGTTVIESALDSDDPAALAVKNYTAATHSGNEEQLQQAMDSMTATNAWDYETRVAQILGKLGLHDATQLVDSLSGGQTKRLALAQVLIRQPEFMILDEPTNHLDLDMIEWLEVFLNGSEITLFMVTHDRYFLERVCNEIVELDGGQLYRYKGNYSYFLEKKAEREMNEQSEISKAKNLYRKELDWMRRQPKARGTKARARIDAFHDTESIASKRIKKDEIEFNVNMQRIGGKILEFHKVKKQFGERIILQGFDYLFKRGEKIGIVGPNGVGKTTFLKMIMGQEEPDGGKITLGETVAIGYYSQEGMKLNEDKRVIEVIREIAEFIPLAGGKKMSALQLLERFMFPSQMHYQYVSKLSGGERRRLYLLTILMKNPNFLILDEPTNDLDVFTLTALEDYLENFEGCVLVVTHDRFFMDRIVDHIFYLPGAGEVKDISGNYSDFREEMKAYQSEERRQVQADRVDKAEKKAEAARDKEKKKLTFKEKFEFDQLDKEIPLLEKDRKELEARLSNGALSVDELSELSSKLGVLMSTIEEKTLRWMELAELQE
ncbi:MAG TPA: ABC-F family ATP-binding cassette domain-containing protein [Flavobacteriales bacterium]|nr:ABC transporter [Flavobacteriales bacterium]HRE75979.1 ABC-F family ATP-binding cassette domain-containing protein [Flavobacteriales bacterium]HRE98479.1 ABC-F family ATP-binding cassette domain-containing protein [Flavobacteriales bacterium]HRJ35682.1 ABC-F family ATP-binding cassette domain-containing protein [Flavobacteriales bacterium]HRJ40112.1 ABC-F family ATP-binding cassette domain-containing protein [Flavobacteriales bacterium]